DVRGAGVLLLLKELAPQDFPDQTPGQLRAELDLLRHLVTSHPCAAIVNDLLGGGRLALAQHYVYLDGLAPALVGYADSYRLEDLGVRVEWLFDITRIDVHTAGDD